MISPDSGSLCERHPNATWLSHLQLTWVTVMSFPTLSCHSHNRLSHLQLCSYTREF